MSGGIGARHRPSVRELVPASPCDDRCHDVCDDGLAVAGVVEPTDAR